MSAAAGLMTQPLRREVALEHRGRAFGVDRVVERMDDVGDVDLGAVDVLADGLAGDGEAGEIELLAQVLHQRAQAAGVEEILHQVFARRPHIGEHRNLARELVELFHVDRNAGAARHRHHMDDGVGRAAHRHVHLDGVVEGGRRQDLVGRQILPHHVDDAAAGDAAHARMIGVGGRDRGRAGQRHAERLGDRHHGRGRAHHHAGAERAGDAALDLVPFARR